MTRVFRLSSSRIVILALIVLAANTNALVAADGPLQIKQVEVGIGGQYKVGCWTPIKVSVKTASAQKQRVRLVVEAPDPDGNPARLASPAVDLLPGSTQHLYGLFRVGRLESDITVQVVRGDEVLAEKLLPLDADQGKANDIEQLKRVQSALLVATLGIPRIDHFLGIDETEEESDDAEPTLRVIELNGVVLRVVKLGDEDDLPPLAAGMDALDVLVIAGEYDLDASRSNSVRKWVQEGGHLVLSIGSNVSGFQQSPLAEWVPIGSVRETRLRELSGLESFAGKSMRVIFQGRVKSALIERPEGNVLVSGLDGPLLAQIPFGFGRVTFCGFDLDRPPFTAWKPLSSVVSKIILGESKEAGDARTSDRGRLSHSGISDLATQLNAAQEYFPTIEPFSVWMISGMILLYLAVIGPVDYLIVHRLLKKPHLTWLTFPLLVVVAVFLTARAGGDTSGNAVLSNQIDVVDIDAVSQLVRSESWMTIYSPKTRRYEVSVEPVDTQWQGTGIKADMLVGWNGFPESAFGGMYRPPGIEFGRPDYRYADKAAGIANLPIEYRSTKGLSARWSYMGGPLAESSLESSRVGHLSGTLSHRLPAALEDWVLAYGRRVYRPRAVGGRGTALAPFQIWSPNGPNVFRRDLKGYLTGARQTRRKNTDSADGVDLRSEATDYDPGSREVGYILQMLTFHEAAGGRTYTSLDNNTLRRHDMSALLHLDRAVLFGRIDSAAAQLLIDGKQIEPAAVTSGDGHNTFVRILLPVKTGHGPRGQLPNFDKNK